MPKEPVNDPPKWRGNFLSREIKTIYGYLGLRGLQGPPTCSLLTFLCNMYCIGIILQIGSIMSMEYL